MAVMPLKRIFIGGIMEITVTKPVRSTAQMKICVDGKWKLNLFHIKENKGGAFMELRMVGCATLIASINFSSNGRITATMPDFPKARLWGYDIYKLLQRIIEKTKGENKNGFPREIA